MFQPVLALLYGMSKAIPALLLCLACTSSPRDVPAQRDSAAPVASADATAQPDTTAREIYIDSVVAGNPVIVYGRARTFENNVQVRIRTAAGDSVTQRFTTSVGEMGHHNPFVVELPIARDPGPRIIVEAFEYSAKDGSVRSLTRREVTYRSARP